MNFLALRNNIIPTVFWVIAFLAVPACSKSALRPEPPDPAVIHANKIRSGTISYKEGYFEWQGMKLHYVEAGEGDLIILYHGFPSFWYSFFDQMEALKGEYRVVAIDGLGAGNSDKPNDLEKYTVAKLSAQVDAFARHLVDDEKFYLIGHDWGGALAWTYAEAYPDRLNGVIGISAPSYNTLLRLIQNNENQRQASQYMRRIATTPVEDVIANPPGERLWKLGYSKLFEKGIISEEEYQLYREALAPAAASNGGFNWYRANVPPFDLVSRSDYWPNPPQRLSVPALLIWGEDDGTFVPEFIELMKTNTDDLQVMIIPEMGHWPIIERPDEANSAISDFLEKTGRQR